jgi:hypothetical protein
MDNEEFKKWHDEKKIMDAWDIDYDIKNLELQLAVLIEQTKDILEKIDDLESYKIIKERVYSADAPVEFIEFDEMILKMEKYLDQKQ